MPTYRTNSLYDLLTNKTAPQNVSIRLLTNPVKGVVTMTMADLTEPGGNRYHRINAANWKDVFTESRIMPNLHLRMVSETLSWLNTGSDDVDITGIALVLYDFTGNEVLGPVVNAPQMWRVGRWISGKFTVNDVISR